MQPSTTRRMILKRMMMLATGEYFSVLLSFYSSRNVISQPIILTYSTEEMVFACPQLPIKVYSSMNMMTAVPTCPTGAIIPTHSTGQATIIAWSKAPA
jgi:hypothetical protein